MIYKFDPAADNLAIVPIGRPAANAQIYVLDRWFNPVPENVIGELYISGDGLAQGYLNRSELTAERFVPNPFIAGQRMYKTGDLARRLTNGELEFLDRADDQVKLRGFRIELGEIEAVLSQHPGVSKSAVLLREDAPGDRRLVAYIVPSQETAPGISEMRRFLQERLPVYMMPTAFVQLENLPMTPNGKVDRRALPATSGRQRGWEVVYVAPETDVERAIAAIWQEVLRVGKVGINDNFFQLGGQSILAIQIIQRINQIFQVNLPMRVIFDEPTIVGLSVLVEEILIGRLEAKSESEFEASVAE
jgi:acyl carrier protein